MPVITVAEIRPAGRWRCQSGGWGTTEITFQATSADTNGAYAFWVDEPPGHVGPPKHVHSREEEGFYVIEGQVEFRAGHIDSVLTKDSFIALPKGIPHSWINTSTGQARLITFTAGAGNEGFFLTLGAPGVGPAGLGQRCHWQRSTRGRAATASRIWRPPTIRWTARSISVPGAVPRLSGRQRASGSMPAVPSTR